MQSDKLFYVIILIILFFSVILRVEGAEKDITRSYGFEFDVFAIGDDLSTYESLGSGTGWGNCEVRIGCNTRHIFFDVVVAGGDQSSGYPVTVRIEQNIKDLKREKNSGYKTFIKDGEYQLELSSMKPRSIEFAIDDAGRQYLINVMPVVKIQDNTAKQVDDNTVRWDMWNFKESHVIINDKEYAGRMGVTGGNIAYINVQHRFTVFFSLKEFAGARDTGVLNDGHISIAGDAANTIDIYNVMNGTYPIQLPGGPFKVWVLWLDAKLMSLDTKEDYLMEFKRRFADWGIFTTLDFLQNYFNGPDGSVMFGIVGLPDTDLKNR